MKRTQCYMAPIFDEKELQCGHDVYFEYKNRKGEVKRKGYGWIKRNNVDSMCIEPYMLDRGYYDVYSNSLNIKASDVYSGKHILKRVHKNDESLLTQMSALDNGTRFYVIMGDWIGTVVTDRDGKKHILFDSGGYFTVNDGTKCIINIIEDLKYGGA